MSALDDLAKLQKRVETAKAETERAKGAEAEILSRLEKEFGCKTLAEAEKKLTDLNRKAVTAETEFKAALAAFEEEFNAELS